MRVGQSSLARHLVASASRDTVFGGKGCAPDRLESSHHPVEQAVQLLRGLAAPFVLLHCNSAYPAPYKDVELGYLTRLRELGGRTVGYSGHERGWHIPVAAVALGWGVYALVQKRLLQGVGSGGDKG